MKLKKGDTVLIISGKDRTKKGKIQKVFRTENKILVEGVNIKKKHVRPKKEGEKGQIVEMNFPFSASNVKLVCPKCGKAVRIGFRIQEKGKARICKKCNQEI